MNFLEFLYKVPVFSEFSEDDLKLLEHTMAVSDYKDGHVFAKEGEAGDAMYLILDGEVAVSRYRSEAPRFDLLEKLGSGEVLGLIALIDHGPRSATCTAVGTVKAASLPRSAFDLLYQSNNDLGYHFQHLIARQLTHDLRNYARALQEGVKRDSRIHMYEILQKSSRYTGLEHRSGDRRRSERRED